MFFAAMDWELPNPTLWAYFAFCTVVALFYQFSRPFAIRNFDLLGLFCLLPGWLVLHDEFPSSGKSSARTIWGYSLLLGASLLGFFRCFYDLSFKKRARISPNLGLPGMIWLTLTLLIGVGIAVASLPSQPSATVLVPTVPVEVSSALADASHQDSTARGDVLKILGITVQVMIVGLLIAIGRAHFLDLPAGIGMALLYLVLPFTVYAFDLLRLSWPALGVLAALLSYRRPRIAGVCLGLVAGMSYYPFLLIPAWCQFYRDRGVFLFLRGFGLAAIVGMTSVIVLNQQWPGIWPWLNEADWQPWRVPSSAGIWVGTTWAYRLPVFVACVGIALTMFVWPMVRNLGQLIAMNAAVLISVQFWLAESGGRAINWYLPLLLLMAFRPTTQDLIPPTSEGQSWTLLILRWWKNRKSRSSQLPPRLPS